MNRWIYVAGKDEVTGNTEYLPVFGGHYKSGDSAEVAQVLGHIIETEGRVIVYDRETVLL